MRVVLAALGLIALAAPALAQQGPAEYILKLSPQAVVLVAKGLQELPYKDVATTLQMIQQQVDQQMKPPAAPAELPKP